MNIVVLADKYKEEAESIANTTGVGSFGGHPDLSREFVDDANNGIDSIFASAVRKKSKAR